MFKETPQHLLALNNISMTEEQLVLLERYYDLSQFWGKQINITRNLSPERFVLENILDPMIALRALQGDRSCSLVIGNNQNNREGKSYADFGCGGGYVGLCWQISNEQVDSCVLVDKVRKKISFCKQVIRGLGIKNTSSINSLANNTGLSGLDYIVTRATWSLKSLLEIKKELPLSLDGKIVYFEGKNSQVGFENDLYRITYRINSRDSAVNRSLVLV